MTDSLKTLTRADLSAAVYDAGGVPLSTAAQFVDAMIDEMVATLETEEALKLSGFGTFKKHRKEARVGRNPKTGVEAAIAPRTVLAFTPSNLVKKAVNEALAVTSV